MILPARHRLTATVAEHLANSHNKHRRWWQRKAHPMDYVPIAREVLGIVLYIPDARHQLDLALREIDQEKQA